MSIDFQKLLEFSIKLIDIQLKKYQGLVKIGIGPDAKINATLVQRQVADLLLNLDGLLKNAEPSEKDMLRFAQLMKFYLDCEFIRGRAGWLLDENKIHNVEYARVSEQLKVLRGFFSEEISELTHPESLNVQQQQCLHDSHAIAYFILDMAAKLKEDPKRNDLGDTRHFGHGFRIMQKHAQPNGRYHEPKISKELETGRRASEDFLHQSSLEKTTDALDKDKAAILFDQDARQMQTLLDSFLKRYPSSELSQKDFEWYQIARVNPVTKPQIQSQGLGQHGFFALGAVALAGTAYALTHLLGSDDSESASSPFNMKL